MTRPPLQLILVLVLVLTILIFMMLVMSRRNPSILIIKRRILTRQVQALTACLDVVPASGRESPGASGELSRHGRLLRDPVGERVLAVLDNGLASLVAVVRSAGFTWCDGGVVDEFEQMLSVAGDDGHLFAVFAQGVELVGVGGLDLLAGDVGELGFGNEGLCLGTDEFLLEDDYSGGVGFFVLELGDLIGDFLLSCLVLTHAVLRKENEKTDCLCWAAPKPQYS